METLSGELHQKMRVGVGGVAAVTRRRREARCDGAHLAGRPDTVRRRPESCLFHSREDFQSFLLRILIKGGTSKEFYICPRKIQPHRKKHASSGVFCSSDGCSMFVLSKNCCFQTS